MKPPLKYERLLKEFLGYKNYIYVKTANKEFVKDAITNSVITYDITTFLKDFILPEKGDIWVSYNKEEIKVLEILEFPLADNLYKVSSKYGVFYVTARYLNNKCVKQIKGGKVKNA